MNSTQIKHVITSNKSLIGLIMGPLSFFIVILLSLFFEIGVLELNKSPMDIFSLSTDTLFPSIALGTMFWMITWWITECVPLGFTGLLAPFIFIIAGILSPQQALQKFSDPIIWIFISGFILASAFKKCRLDERIAYKLGTLYKGNNPKIAIFFVACLPVFVLSMTGSITASTTIVFPLVIAFLRISNSQSFSSSSSSGHDKTNTIRDPVYQSNQNKDVDKEENKGHHYSESKKEGNKKSNYEEASFLSLGQAATAGAMLLLISTAPNLIAKSTVEEFVPGMSITFTDWFLVGAPHAIIGLFISWNIIFLLIKPEIRSISSTASQFKEKLLRMGKITKEEKVVLFILLSALLLWTIPSLLRSFYPIGSEVQEIDNFSTVLVSKLANSIPISIPALLIILSLGLIRIKNGNLTKEDDLKNDIVSYNHRESNDDYNMNQSKSPSIYHPILNWEEMLKSVDWNIIFLFGGGLVLGLGIESSGLASIIGSEISNAAGARLTELSIFALSAILGFILSYAASNTASAVIACPIAATLAIGAGFNPIPPIIAAGLGASISSAIPSATPPMAIAYSSRKVTILNMFKTGMVSDLSRLMILILLGPFLIQIVY